MKLKAFNSMIGPYHFYRVANFLYCKHVPILPKLLDHFIRGVFACWLSKRRYDGQLLCASIVSGNGTVGN